MKIISAQELLKISDKKNIKSYNIIPFFLHCAGCFKELIVCQLFVAVICAIDLSLRPYLLKTMLDQVVGINPAIVVEVLIIPITFYVGMTFVNAFILRFENYIWLYINPEMKSYIALKLTDKLISYPYTFYQNNFAGSLATKVKDVMSGIPDLSRILFYKVFSHILVLFITIYTIWYAKPIFAYTLLSWILIYLVGSVTMSVTAKKLTDLAGEARSVSVGYLSDLFGNILNLWLFNSKSLEKKEKFSPILQNYINADQK